jgi:hypothetical protein
MVAFHGPRSIPNVFQVGQKSPIEDLVIPYVPKVLVLIQITVLLNVLLKLPSQTNCMRHCRASRSAWVG